MDTKLSFSEKCYQLLCEVPQGKVTTYKLMAEALGTKAYRAVGNAMYRNPNAPKVPCHRVVANNGHLNGYAFGLDNKKKLLKSEGISFNGDKVFNLKEVLYRFEKGEK